jgi:hypothetical protein
MNNQNIVFCVVAFLFGMFLSNLLQNVCGCEFTEGQNGSSTPDPNELRKMIIHKISEWKNMEGVHEKTRSHMLERLKHADDQLKYVIENR